MFSLRLAFLAITVSSAIAGVIPLTDDCIKGVTFEGTPKGNIDTFTINGVATYVAKAQHSSNPNRALLLLTDIFGLPLVNSKLMADDFAANGFDTFIPDYLNGDPVPVDDPTFNMTAWLPNHTEAQTMPTLLAAIDGLKKEGFKEFLSTGYCFGGLYSTRLSQQNIVKVGTMAHPSLLTVPDDFETLLANSHVPIQMNSAELDTAFSPAVQAIADGILGDGKYRPGYDRPFFTGVGHGFAVRANLSNPIEKEAKEGAFFAAVKWLRAHD
ncbi:dienelactone hydrolase endo-1,3,1,4-beta-D-glucanase [Collybia nuda]|uniref:Dienelactone hydrolase endo-1,3,1,4-beta-D-glucanase n=1 Tax=Collybia nuda TaxID=64659 RepID=A0A9P5XY54_9AGAR|nr:dienelactone hydrolase endo-1,3,1,4-beta-D-glucanase [Collybia nuda]